jgi:hypothetical protein
VILVLGVAVGITVPQVYHFSPWITAVVLLSLLIVVLALGSYSVWSDTNETLKIAAVGGEAQARLVEVRKISGLGSGWFTPQVVYINVLNGSDGGISDLVFSWRLGTDPWGDHDHVSYVAPGKSAQVSRRLPPRTERPVGPSSKAYSAYVYFKDASGVYWCATPREDTGDLNISSPDQEQSPA